MSHFISKAADSALKLYPDAYINEKGLVRDQEYKGLTEVLVSYRGTVGIEAGDEALAPVISTTTLTDATVDTAYAFQLLLTEGDAPVRWYLTEGILPEGLTLSLTGEIAGTPVSEEATSETFTVRAANAVGFVEKELTLAVVTGV